jgi:hypothetical protein
LKQLFPGAVHSIAFLHLRKNACLVCSGARLGMRAETVQDHSATVGRNQTEARVTRVPRHVGFSLDQATGMGTANNAENANGAFTRPGSQTWGNGAETFICVICGSPYLASMQSPPCDDPRRILSRRSALSAVYRKITAGCGDLEDQ